MLSTVVMTETSDGLTRNTDEATRLKAQVN